MGCDCEVNASASEWNSRIFASGFFFRILVSGLMGTMFFEKQHSAGSIHELKISPPPLGTPLKDNW